MLFIFLVQIHFRGVSNCEEWRDRGTTNKSSAIVNTLAEHINAQCNCSFPVSHINQTTFKCFANSPNYVTFRASIFTFLDLTGSYLIKIIENWVNSQESVFILEEHLYIDKCPVKIVSYDHPECLPKVMPGNSLSVIIASTSATLLAIITIFLLLSGVILYNKYKWYVELDIIIVCL